MKCEIINGWLVVEPSSETERWAFQQWLEGRNSWDNVNSCVRSSEPVRKTVDVGPSGADLSEVPHRLVTLSGPHTHTLGPTPLMHAVPEDPRLPDGPMVAAAVTVGTTGVLP